jgi:glucose/arabinose dehydrogenase
MNWRKRGWMLALVLAACSPDAADDPAPTTSAATVPAPITTTSTSSSTSTTSTVPDTTTTTEPLPPLVGLAVEPVASGLSQPVLLISPPGSDRRFVVERVGTVRELRADGAVVGEPYIDLRDRVNSGGIEQGLLGMAFHPLFADNGRIFVYYYHGADTTRLVELIAEPAASAVDVATERVMLTLDKPTVRHNGGMLEFGPDGMLYLSLGEGGAASTHSQNPETLLSSILRLDVDGAEPYGIPANNPFVDGGGAPEVWAFGLRNPWRFAIDAPTATMWIADVGHERWEEINVVSLVAGGKNFGWLRMEGTSCFQRGCDPEAEGLQLPVHEYGHDEGCSITGGRVYRGTAIPELDGAYLYSDWCGGWLRSFRWNGVSAVDHIEWLTGLGQVNSFGVDGVGELYILTWTGDVGRIVGVRDG